MKLYYAFDTKLKVYVGLDKVGRVNYTWPENDFHIDMFDDLVKDEASITRMISGYIALWTNQGRGVHNPKDLIVRTVDLTPIIREGEESIVRKNLMSESFFRVLTMELNTHYLRSRITDDYPIIIDFYNKKKMDFYYKISPEHYSFIEDHLETIQSTFGCTINRYGKSFYYIGLCDLQEEALFQLMFEDKFEYKIDSNMVKHVIEMIVGCVAKNPKTKEFFKDRFQ